MFKRLPAALAQLAPVAAMAQSASFHVVDQPEVERRAHQFSRKNADRERTLKELFEEAGCAYRLLAGYPAVLDVGPDANVPE